MQRQRLTIRKLQLEAKRFAIAESSHYEPSLFGVTDGKAVGTYLEHKFIHYLQQKYGFESGSSAKGIDFPALLVDVKVTSFRQPQSSCPFRDARQKIFGLGYSILLFVYEKSDDNTRNTSNLNILHTIFIEEKRTGDYQLTRVLNEVVENDGNEDDIIAVLTDRNLPVDEILARKLAEEVLESPPEQGYLTISNALQWRLQYGRVVSEAGSIDGVIRIR